MSQKINKISIGGNEYDIEDKSLWQVVESLVSNNGYKLVKLGTGNTTFELTPNVFYVWDKVDSLTLSLKPVSSGIAGEYLFQFISGRNGTELILPENISWNNSIKPVTINPNKVYQVRILMNCANLEEFDIINDKNYFTIESLEDGNEVYFSKTDNAKDLFYSISGGDWISYTSETTLTVNNGENVRFRGNLTPEPADNSGIGKFTVNKAFNVVGNIMSLLYGDDFEGQTDLSGKECAFLGLFWNCTTLQNAENLILPATTLTINCYSDMFYGCTSLTKAPKLPASTLVRQCYSGMFYNCSKLNKISMLATDISAKYCLDGWVSGVASTGTFVKHINMTSLPSGASGIPSGWTVEDYWDNPYDAQ